MSEVARNTVDKCNGLCGNSPELPSTFSPNVYVNGKQVIRQTDLYSPHSVVVSHTGRSVLTGSSTVFANGLQLARKNDPISCGAKIATGSPTVFAG